MDQVIENSVLELKEYLKALQGDYDKQLDKIQKAEMVVANLKTKIEDLEDTISELERFK